MAQGTIDNPVINSPFVEPQRHFVMLDGKPTGRSTIVGAPLSSSYRSRNPRRSPPRN